MMMWMENRVVGLAVWAAVLAGCGSASSGAPEEPVPVVGEVSRAGHSERRGIGVSWEAPEGVSAQAVFPMDPRRSLAVTDKAILASFPLRAVMDQLHAQNGGVGFTGEQLFRQLWDTQNPAPGQPDLPASPHCTDFGGTLNGFPYPCRALPGGEGIHAPLAALTKIDNFAAVGLYNRFDLAPAEGTDCGEYRIVYAKADATPGRNFIIFEAVLPNPRPDLGLEGCRPVADFWSNLTADPSLASRATKLRDFYFLGLPGFSPVIHGKNYGDNPAGLGQVRTNQFVQPPWLMREFKLRRDCAAGCTLKLFPQTVKVNPFGDLFDPFSLHGLAPGFQAHFLTQVPALAVNDINTFNYEVPDTFNVGQSDSQTPFTVDNYMNEFGIGPSGFHADIANALASIGSPLTPRDVVARAQALSCGGCHQRSSTANLGGGLFFPSPAPGGFVHSSEAADPADPSRFDISPALRNVFLPHRRKVSETWLATPARAAVFVGQSVPASVPAGTPFSVSVTMRNTGTTAWSEGNTFRLGAPGGPTWGFDRVMLAPPELIHNGVDKTFTFTAIAPGAPGVYAFQWRMVEDGSGSWFGTASPVVNVNVTP